ncbi:MAG: thiamine diphosphokinase [Lachnospiraceae bacterium]|nr:thiamine diphosphokinase [Lachnospiraceae bacterium]
MKKTMIVAGGVLDDLFLQTTLQRMQPDEIIAADRGLDALLRNNILPTRILGDYDSTKVRDKLGDYQILGIPVETYKAEKDFTDTEAAVDMAVSLGSTEIHVLGATGGRLDHFLSNVSGLLIALWAGIYADIMDPQNIISLHSRPFILKKEATFGKYVSLMPLGDKVEGLTLEGFKYPLAKYTLNQGSSLCISNELAAGEGRVTFTSGTLILILSQD